MRIDYLARKNDRTTGRHAARTRRRRRIFVERLEDRALLTTLFTSQHGTPVVSDGGGDRLGQVSWGMPLYSIFWGSYWATPAGQAQQAALENSLNTMFFFNPTLSGLNQYGVRFPAGVPGGGTVEVNDFSDPPDNFSKSRIDDVVSNAIDNLGLPEEDDFSNGGFYLVFTPPGKFSDVVDPDPPHLETAVGYHTSTTDFDFPFDFDTWHYAWIGNFNSQDIIPGANSQGQDFITQGISHEVMEAMTDPNGDGIRASVGHGNEIADGEAESYAALVGGYEVSSFWSARDNAYAVYDGNSQVVTFDNGNLIINGDQFGFGTNDTITVDLNSEGQPLITLNGQTFSFTSDPSRSRVNSITINSGGGTNTINVLRTSSLAPVTINGSSRDTVNIGVGGRVQDIGGNVTIENPPSFTAINVDDSADSFPRQVLLSTDTPPGDSPFGAITGLSPGAIIYEYGDTSSLTLNMGSGATVDVLATGVPTTLVGHGLTTVNVGVAGSVQQIIGALNIENPPSFTTLNVDDSADTVPRLVSLFTFTSPSGTPSGAITDLAPASIVYKYADTRSLTLNTGSGATVDVLATGVSTTLVGHGPTTVNAGNSGSVQDILGALDIENPPRFTTLNVDDSVDPTGRAATLTTFLGSGGSAFGLITGLAPAPISYKQADTSSPVTIDGGSGADTFAVPSLPVQAIDLNTGDGDDTVVLLTTVGGLVVDGQGGTNTLIGPDVATTWNITNTNAGTITGVATFTNVQNLTGGAADDTFQFAPAGSVTGGVSGGLGTNRLDYSLDGGSAATVNLATSTASRTGGIAGIQALVGSTSAVDRLIGPNATNLWSITGANAGSVGTFSFSAVENLTGGSGVDEFAFGNDKSVSGAIDGGAGSNWLDYALYTTPVAVNLATGTATGASGGIAGIQDVRGGSGGNTLTGNALGNILIGGAGVDTITGGDGRSILIGGRGNDTVRGGSADDIVIGGFTDFDTSSDANDQALMAILTEWQSADPYTTRIAKLKAGVGPMLATFVFGTTVHDDGNASTLTGGPGADWFFKGARDKTKDKAAGEQVN
jgi:hypothetical protein